MASQLLNYFLSILASVLHVALWIFFTVEWKEIYNLPLS